MVHLSYKVIGGVYYEAGGSGECRVRIETLDGVEYEFECVIRPLVGDTSKPNPQTLIALLHEDVMLPGNQRVGVPVELVPIHASVRKPEPDIFHSISGKPWMKG